MPGRTKVTKMIDELYEDMMFKLKDNPVLFHAANPAFNCENRSDNFWEVEPLLAAHFSPGDQSWQPKVVRLD